MRLGGFSHHFSSYIAQEPVSYRPNYLRVGDACRLFLFRGVRYGTEVL